MAFEYSPIALALVGPDGRYLQANPAMCELTGYTDRELLDRTVADLTHPDDLDADAAAMAALLAGDRSTYTVEKRFLSAAGTVIWGAKSATLVRNEDGSLLHFISQILDITAAKEYSQALVEERRRLREAESIGRVGSWELDTVTQQVVWSAGMFQIWGIDPDTFGGDYAAAVRQIYPEDAAIVDTAVASCVATGEPIHIRYRVVRADDGALRWIDGRGEAIYRNGQLVRIGGVVADVTDEVVAEAEALAAHSFQQAVISASPDIIAVWDLASWSIVWVNRSITDLLGYDAQDVADMAGDLTGHLVVDEDKAALYAAVEATRNASDDEVIPADFRMLHKDGTERWFSRRAAPLRRDEHGRVTQIVTVTRDTTEEKLVQAALRDSEAVFHQLAENVDVAFLLRSFDPPEFIYVSPRFQEMFGYNPMTVHEAPADTLRRIHPDDLERFLRDYWAPSQAGVPATCEYRIVSTDGIERWVRAKSAPVASADGKMRRSASTAEDITARRQAEAALRSAQEAEKTAMVAARDAALATDPKVKTVFDTWKGLFPYLQTQALGRTWQEAAQTLVKKQAGMYLLGMFVGQQFPAGDTDLDFFPFPEVDSNVGTTAVEAPIDGFLLSSKGESPQAKAMMTYLASPEAQLLYLGADPSNVAANKTASTAKYTALQKHAVELISSAKNISQFLDRDSRPDFASPVVIPALQQFLKDGDSTAVTKSLEAQAKTIFTS